MTILASFALAAAVAQAAPAEEPPRKPAITIQSADAPGVKVFYLNAPWGPNTFAAMEKPGEGFYNKRTWPFARLETTRAVSIGGTSVPAGNYAMVFVPNTTEDKGMSIELRKLSVAEFLQPGNVMTPTPEGPTVWHEAARFERTETTEPALKIDLAPHMAGTKLVVRYGDRRLVRDLAY
jgi:hypothetical protein